MEATIMKSYDVTAVYNTGQTLIIKHSTQKSAENTIKILKHNAKVENEQVKIIKGWEQ